jgi:hypothetical protein
MLREPVQRVQKKTAKQMGKAASKRKRQTASRRSAFQRRKNGSYS